MRCNNQSMSPIPHPNGSGTMLRVPQKIFKTCLLLDIVIPRWDFNQFNGYIVSSDNPEDIDALERTADWSRQQRELEGGAEPGGAGVGARGAGPAAVPVR